MVTLRATGKVLRYLQESSGPHPASDTALGDWYVNRVLVLRQPLLLVVSALSLLPLVIRAQNVSTLADRLPYLVSERLRRLGVAEYLVQAEATAMVPVLVGKTVDRSVLGILVDFAKSIPHYAAGRAELDLPYIESHLSDTPCFAGRSYDQVIFPKKKAPELLRAKWGTRQQ